MKKALLGGAAVAMIAAFVPSASAVTTDPSSIMTTVMIGAFGRPGCFFVSFANETIDPQGNQDGIIGAVSIATDASNHPDKTATIACWIATPTTLDLVSSTLLDATHGTVPVTNNGGVITGLSQISYSDGANHDQNVYLCEKDTDASGSTTKCTLAVWVQIPPQAVLDAVIPVNNAVSALLCPITATLAGSYAGGLIVIDTAGNVFVPNPLGNPFIGPCPGALPI